MMKKIILMLLLVAGTWSLSHAQPGNKKEKLESLRVAFITQQLDLTPEEAQTFWPVFNKYQDEIEAVRKARKTELLTAMVNFDDMSDAEVLKLIDNAVSFEEQELAIRKKYIVEFKKVLPPKKVVKLLRAEQAFKIKILQEIQNRGKGGGGKDKN